MDDQSQSIVQHHNSLMNDMQMSVKSCTAESQAIIEAIQNQDTAQSLEKEA